MAAEGVGCFLEMGTRYVADGEGDVPLGTLLPYLSGAGLEEGILASTSLKDGDSSLVIAEEMDELMLELRSP